MPTDEMVAIARDAFNAVYDGPGSEEHAMRSALAAVRPMIRTEALREAAEVAASRETALDREVTLTAGGDRGYALAREDEAATIRRAILARVTTGGSSDAD